MGSGEHLAGELTQDKLRSILHYCAESGRFTWLKPPSNHQRMLGKEAGSTGTGYVLIKIDGRRYKAHRLAWLYVYGEMPAKGIDHRDGDPFNNSLSNLRPATQSQNNANARLRAGKVLPKGVRLAKSRFSARIRYRGRLITIGTFDTPEQASAAYLAEAQRLFGEFARAG